MLKHNDFIKINNLLNQAHKLQLIFGEMDMKREPGTKFTNEMLTNMKAARKVIRYAKTIAVEAGYMFKGGKCECGGICFMVLPDFWVDYKIAEEKARNRN